MASGVARRTAGRSGAAVLLALLAGLTISAPREVAAAGCSHLAMPAGMAYLEGLAATGALVPLDAKTSRPIPGSPCAGLRCATDTPFAPAPAGSSIRLRAETWGLLPCPVRTANSQPIPFSVDEPAARPLRRAVTLLRPPR